MFQTMTGLCRLIFIESLIFEVKLLKLLFTKEIEYEER